MYIDDYKKAEATVKRALEKVPQAYKVTILEACCLSHLADIYRKQMLLGKSQEYISQVKQVYTFLEEKYDWMRSL